MKISNKNTSQVMVDKLIRSFLNLQKYMNFCNYLQTSPIGHTNIWRKNYSDVRVSNYSYFNSNKDGSAGL